MSDSRFESACEFERRCREPNFFRDIEHARAILKPILECAFPGTSACRQFLIDYDLRGVGYSSGDPFDDMSPGEWLRSLGIDTKENSMGVFKHARAHEFEWQCLKKFTGPAARQHLMVGYACADPQADYAAWGELLDRWQKEFLECYEGIPLGAGGPQG